MNANTGEMRMFKNRAEAIKDGFEMPLSEQMVEKLSGLLPRDRVERCEYIAKTRRERHKRDFPRRFKRRAHK